MHIKEFTSFDEFREYIEEKYSTYETWTTGGIQGGDCWGNDPSYPVSPTPEPAGEFEDILLDICPDIEFSEFVELRKQEIITREENNYHEYYGNCTYGMKKEINLEKLYAYLKKLYS